MEQLLIVEDDKSLNMGLTRALKTENRSVVSCFDLRSAREQLSCGGVSAVILDVNLPDGSGLELLQEIKKVRPSLPVILLTANDTDMDIVEGLEQGADDYITKPFSLTVLRARVNTQLRKAMPERQKDVFENRRFRFDFFNMKYYVKKIPIHIVSEIGDSPVDFSGKGEQTVFSSDKINNVNYIAGEIVDSPADLSSADGQISLSSNKSCCANEVEVELSKTEQKLLRLLVENCGRTMSRYILIDRIWTDGSEYVDENALSVTVKRLRDKLGAQKEIKTVYGVGYVWRNEDGD